MQSARAAEPAPAGWLAPALIGVGLVTLARVLLLAFNRTDLFVDEAQYWLWGQDLALGYYSKPPMIGWVIRAFTELGGDGSFWIRLPGPLFHGATALILGGIAARLWGRRAALLVAMGYVTLPMVAVGSLLISTDTIMFPFLAAALAGYLRLTERSGSMAGTAVLTGVALGLAFLSKYAAIYYLICAVIALPVARPALRDAALAIAAFLVTASPNLVWNIANGLTTVQHTLDNADWVRDPGARAGLHWASLAEFLAAQFAVFGPVLFGALLLLALRWRRHPRELRLLLLFALPIIAMVCIQALLSRAYANWAAAAYLAGTLAVLPRLTRPWLIANFAINGAMCLLFPLAATAPELLTRGGQPLLSRHIGRAEMSRQILDTAARAGLRTIVAADRDILADLFHTGRGQGIAIRALAPPGRPPHHYAQAFPFAGADDPVLFVAPADRPAPCPEAELLAQIRPETGAYRTHPQALYRVTSDCLLN